MMYLLLNYCTVCTDTFQTFVIRWRPNALGTVWDDLCRVVYSKLKVKKVKESICYWLFIHMQKFVLYVWRDCRYIHMRRKTDDMCVVHTIHTYYLVMQEIVR